MSFDPRVRGLIEQVLDSEQSAEALCRNSPELLAPVREGLRKFRAMQAQVGALFPDGGSAVSDATKPMFPEGLPRIPGYEVIEELGRGGFGVVYKARHLGLNRPVALKMLLAGAYASRADRQRLSREAELLAGLRHPNIVQVYDVGDLDGRPFFTMEFVEGGSLDRNLAGRRLPAREAASLLALLTDAVDAAHGAGIVHRDLKPANVLIAAGDTPKISDFGLARQLGDVRALTQSGAPLGTPSYMAPEQAQGRSRDIGPATDLYALGAILYELLTGRPPFHGESAAETVQLVLSQDPLPPSRLNPRVPRDLETVALKCLHKDPRRRYSTAADLADDLNLFLRDQPIAARPVGRLERALRWVRRNPTATALIVTATLLLCLTGAAGVREWELAVQLSERLALVTRLQEEGRFAEARGILREPHVDASHLRKQFERASADMDLVQQLDDIRLSRGYQVRGGLIDYSESSRRYGVAFREWGLGDLQQDPDRVAARLNTSPIRNALVAALDDWAACADKGERDWVLKVARRMDPDPWRDRVRDAERWETVKSFPELAKAAGIEDQPVTLMVAFGTRWRRLGGDPTEFLEQVQRQHPDEFWVNFELGHLLGEKNRTAAISYYRSAQALRPDAAVVQIKLAYEFRKLGQLENAIHHSKRATTIAPDQKLAWEELGLALLDNNQTDEAVDCFRKSASLDPSDFNLLTVLRDLLLRLGRHVEACAVWRQLIDLEPEKHGSRDGYAELCLFLGDAAEYHGGCRKLLEQFASNPNPQNCERIGRACLLMPETPEQVRRATELIDRALATEKSRYPAWATPFFLFSKALAQFRQGDFRGAIATLQGDASRVMGPAPKIVLAMARYQSGEVDEARRTLAAAIMNYDWRATSARQREIWIYHVLRREAEAMLVPNLPAFLDGTYHPADQWERLAFVGAAELNGLFGASTQFYADAFAADPSLVNDPGSWLRYNAACKAAWAGCGRNAPKSSEEERMRQRDQSRRWLWAELDAWKRKVDGAPPATQAMEQVLKHWRTDPDLAKVREAKFLDSLLAEESRAWRELWQEVDVRVERVGGAKSSREVK